MNFGFFGCKSDSVRRRQGCWFDSSESVIIHEVTVAGFSAFFQSASRFLKGHRHGNRRHTASLLWSGSH